jgi:hypothetical protein
MPARAGTDCCSYVNEWNHDRFQKSRSSICDAVRLAQARAEAELYG